VTSCKACTSESGDAVARKPLAPAKIAFGVAAGILSIGLACCRGMAPSEHQAIRTTFVPS